MTAETTLDIEQPEALIAYLQSSGRIDSDEQPVVRKLEGGVSNRTVFVERANGETWVLKQALEKLRVPVDWFSSPERIHREALGTRYLSQLAPPGTIPSFIFEDHHQHVLAMMAVPQPHANWKTLLLNGQLQRDHVEQFGQLLGTIHRKAYERRDSVAAAFDDRSFFESLRIEPYYSYTVQHVPEAADFIHKLIEDTRATRLTLVHGDYSPKNILVYQDRLILLDHEVIHFGDPAFDIGFSMTHLLSKAHHLTDLRAALSEAALDYWNAYRPEVDTLTWARELELRAIRHTLACLLARVAGRSKLEYLGEAERVRQRKAVLNLMAAPPENMVDLVERFGASLR